MTTNLRFSTLIMTAVLSCSTLVSANVKKPHKLAPPSAPVAHEVYTATEEEIDNPPPPRPLSQEQMHSLPKPRKSTAEADHGPQRKQMPGVSPVIVVTPPPALPATPTRIATLESATGFDPVPTDQMGAVMRRLRLVEEIISKHGRAYDYRSHTVHELEAILAQLEAAPEASAPSAPSAENSRERIRFEERRRQASPIPPIPNG